MRTTRIESSLELMGNIELNKAENVTVRGVPGALTNGDRQCGESGLTHVGHVPKYDCRN